MSLHNGDCLDVMRGMDDNSVDLVLTDPPYGLKFMGKKWDCSVPAVEIWAEALRVLKPGGHVLAFAGARTQHRMAVNIEDAGFEIRDMLAWIYGSGFPKNAQCALKPALEPITMARKPLVGTVAANVLEYGTGALNIDDCRVGTDGGGTQCNNRDESGKCLGHKNAGRSTSGETFHGPNATTLGRWPANLIHDGSEEVVALFPESSTTGKRSEKSQAASVAGTTWGPNNHLSSEYTDSGSAARYFYCAKASKKERDAGLDGPERRTGGSLNKSVDNHARKLGVDVGPRHNPHPTVKPIALMEYLCKLASRPGATVLDPFMGSGTTGIACKNLGRDFIGIELDPEYFQIASARIKATTKQQELAL